MGVDVGITQLGGYAVFQPLGNEVLEPLGFLVNFIPRIVQEIVKESFQEPMVTHNFQRTVPPGWREEHTVMFLIVDPSGFVAGQLLKHSGYRGCSDAEPLRKSVAGDPLFFWSAQFEYCLQVIVYRLRGEERLCLR